ncbi:hypothetical protein ACFL1G_07065 [Planctomycetota bacterium]
MVESRSRPAEVWQVFGFKGLLKKGSLENISAGFSKVIAQKFDKKF